MNPEVRNALRDSLFDAPMRSLWERGRLARGMSRKHISITLMIILITLYISRGRDAHAPSGIRPYTNAREFGHQPFTLHKSLVTYLTSER